MQENTTIDKSPQQQSQQSPILQTNKIISNNTNEELKKQNNSLFDIMDTITNTIKQDFNQLIEDVKQVQNIDNVQDKENGVENGMQKQEQRKQEQQKQVEAQASNENQIGAKDGKQQFNEDIENIRRKQRELLQQLQQLRQKQRELLGIKDKDTDEREQLQAEQQQTGKQQQQEQQNFFYFLQSPNKTESPVKRNRYPRKPKPKLVVPDPIVPQMSRQQFEQKVKKMAGNIRSKVHKLNPLVKDNVKNIIETKSLKKSRQISQKKRFVIQLPQIKTKKNIMKMSVTQNIKSISMEDNSQQNQQIEQNVKQGIDMQNVSGLQGQIQMENSENKNMKKMRWIVEQLIKKAFEKIRYKQKYGIKLDPVHHKYPMTTFRRKILQQKHIKQKQRYNSQTLRQSVLNQRKSIFQKSRNNK